MSATIVIVLTCLKKVKGEVSMKLRKLVLGSLVSLSLVGLLTACAPKKEATKTSTDTKTEKVVTMKLGAMPAPDSAPLFVAAKKGYFKEEGIDATVQLYRDATKRDAAVSANQLDGTVTDLVMYTSYITGKTGWKLGTALTGKFGVVVRDPNVKTVQDLKGKIMGNLPRAVADYYMSKLMKPYNMTDDDLVINKVAEIPTKLQMMKDGKMDGAVMPEPFLTMAKAQGLHVINESDPTTFKATAMAFNKKISGDKDLMTRFNRAYNKAVKLLNSDPDVVKSVIVDDLGLPQAVADKAKFPKYEEATPVSNKTFTDVIKFSKEKGVDLGDIKAKNYIINF